MECVRGLWFRGASAEIYSSGTTSGTNGDFAVQDIRLEQIGYYAMRLSVVIIIASNKGQAVDYVNTHCSEPRVRTVPANIQALYAN